MDNLFAALSPLYAKLEDELRQDEESPLHNVLREYQTFLKRRIRGLALTREEDPSQSETPE